jgi:hypothetical protein
MDAIRKLIARVVAERGLDLKKVSKELGRNPAYMQQYLRRGVPKELPERERLRLSELLDLPESQLGAPRPTMRETATADGLILRQHDTNAAAGDGAVIDQETEIGRWDIPKDYVRHGLSLRSPETSLSLITVAGDSMVPTLFPGDVIMVDLADKNPSNPGIFVLYADGVTVVKRLERIPTIRPPKLRLISDNQKHTPYDVLASLVNIAGRVVWFARRM